MNRWQPSAWLPLLTKELTESANRRRTYVARLLYGLVIFAGGLFILYGRHGITRPDATAQLGEGFEMFQNLVQLQFAAVYLFLPAMTAGAFTQEKERDTLTLLLLTTMQPWAIVLQKLLSRVIPMLCLVVFSFPLLAAAYSFGGVTTDNLFTAMRLLTIGIVQVAALALMCSAYFRTTVESFIAVYGLLALSAICCPIAVPLLVFQELDAGLREQELFVREAMMAGGSVACLIAARYFLLERAFVPPRNVMLQLFQALDRMFNEMNTVTGGVILVRDGDRFPKGKPVAWRETAKKSLGTFRYLFRVLVVLELPILFVAQSINVNAIRNDATVTTLLYIVWCIAVAMVCVHAASVVSSERSRQTIDVLLTVPITGRELLLQKLAGVRRLMGVLWVPFLSIFLFHHWFRDYGMDVSYLLASIGTVAIFLPLTAWTALLIGLRIRAPMRAVFATLALVATTFAGPIALEALFGSARGDGWLSVWANISPLGIVQGIERWHTLRATGDTPPHYEWALAAGVLAVAGVALFLLRRFCLAAADRLLGRVVES